MVGVPHLSELDEQHKGLEGVLWQSSRWWEKMVTGSLDDSLAKTSSLHRFSMLSLEFVATLLQHLALATLAQLSRVRLHPAKDKAVGAPSVHVHVRVHICLRGDGKAGSHPDILCRL